MQRSGSTPWGRPGQLCSLFHYNFTASPRPAHPSHRPSRNIMQDQDSSRAMYETLTDTFSFLYYLFNLDIRKETRF